MSQSTTDNFWQVMRSFSWPDPEPVQYRLYHDDQGRPLFYTMETLPGTYIEVDQTTYVKSSHDVVVRNGRLIELRPRVQVSRLYVDAVAGQACDPRDVCVIVPPDRVHKKWKKMINEID